MQIQVNITLAEDDPNPSMTPAEMLEALGGDPSKDRLNVSVSAAHTPPPPQEPRRV